MLEDRPALYLIYTPVLIEKYIVGMLLKFGLSKSDKQVNDRNVRLRSVFAK